MKANALIPQVSSATPTIKFPSQFKRGCLPRKSRFGELFRPASESIKIKAASEAIKIIPKDQWAKYSGAVDLTAYIKQINDQNGFGSCATESTAKDLELINVLSGNEFELLNPLFIYHHTSYGRDQGSSIDENLAFIQEYGCAPESVWPRSKGWREKPSPEAYEAALKYRNIEVFDIANINEMISALLTGFGVVYGADGHSVLKVKHIDDSKGLDVNSWGKGWGDGGFGVWASYRAVDFRYGAFAIRAIR